MNIDTGHIEQAIYKAMEKETSVIVERAIVAAKTNIEREIRSTAANIVVNCFKLMSFESFGKTELRITIHIKDPSQVAP